MALPRATCPYRWVVVKAAIIVVVIVDIDAGPGIPGRRGGHAFALGA